MRIVLGSDHRLFVDALADALCAKGITVAARGTSPQELLSAVDRYQPDICMLGPGFGRASSLDVLHLIGRRHPDVKVVMFSDSSDPAVVSVAIDGGAAGLISKDQRVTDVVRTLVRVRAGERGFDGDQAGLHALEPGSADCLPRALTFREQEVLMLMLEGESTKQIARSLAISVSTARTHVQSTLIKLGAHSRLEASSIAARCGVPGKAGLPELGLPGQAAASR